MIDMSSDLYILQIDFFFVSYPYDTKGISNTLSK